MSASKKKRERQDSVPLTEREKKQAQEAASARRNKILYSIVGVVLAVAVVVLLVWDSGIIQRNAVAATIDGVDYTVADVSYYYHLTKNQFINEAEQMRQQYGFNLGYDATKSPAQQTYTTDEETGEITTYADFFRESALENLKQVIALSDAAKAEGYTLSEEGQASLDSQSAQIDTLVSQYGGSRVSILKQSYGPYATEELFAHHMGLSTLASDYLATFQDGIDTSDEALDAYYQESAGDLDNFTFRYASIKGSVETETDADGNEVEATEEEKTAAKADAQERAEAMLTAVKAGEDFDTIAKDYVSEVDKGTYETEDYTLRSGTVGSSLSTIYQEWLQNADREAGDVELFEDEESNGYVLVEYVSRERDETTTVNVRHILIAPEGDTEEATEFTDEQWAAAEEKAKTILADFMAGDKTAEAFGELAEEHSADGRGTDGNLASPGGLYNSVTPGQMVPEFDAWIYDASRTTGDTDIVKTDYGYHVMYFQGINEPNWKGTAETALVNESRDAWMEEKTEGYDVQEQAGMAYVK